MNALSVPHPLQWSRRTAAIFAVILATVAVAITLAVTVADSSSGAKTRPGLTPRRPPQSAQVQCRPVTRIGSYC